MSTPPDASNTGDAAARRPRRTLFSARTIARRHRAVITIALTVLFLALRLVFLDADPPTSLPNDARSYELFTDPPAKSYEARSYALFGAWKTAEGDNYAFWRPQAPAWVYPLGLYYRVFGASYVTMRVFSIGCATVGLLAFLALLAKKLRGLPFLAAGLLLTCNFYFIVFTRSGLLEALLTTYIVLTVYFLVRSRDHLGWLVAAVVAFVLAFLTKQTGLYLVPLLIGTGFVRILRARGAPLWLRALPVAAFAAAVALLAWQTTRPDYVRTVAWNYSHMVLGDTPNARHASPVVEALQRLFERPTWTVGYFTLFPIAGALALVEAAFVVVAIARRRARDWEVIVTIWGFGSFGVMLFTPHLAVHYRLFLFPAVAALAGAAIARLGRIARHRRLIRGGLGVLVAAGLGLHVYWFAGMTYHRRYEIASARRAILKAVGKRPAVFAGMWAGPLVFGTPYQWYYIKSIFNQSAEVIDQFGITHQIATPRNDLANDRIRVLYRAQVQDRRRIASPRVRGLRVDVYELKAPLKSK